MSGPRADDPGDRSDEVLEEVAGLARELAQADGLDDLLQRIVDLGHAHLEGCDGVSMMFIRKGGKIDSPAYSSSVAYESDQAQYRTNEGPCLESIREHSTIIIDDLETEQRWPDFRRAALELGVRSMISFRLFMASDTMGALNFYSGRPHVFDERSRLVGQVFASHAAVALKSAIVEVGLQAALSTRDLIGQAKGILMEREGLTADAAFARLRDLSQQRNVAVREIAEEIAETGFAPPV